MRLLRDGPGDRRLEFGDLTLLVGEHRLHVEAHAVQFRLGRGGRATRFPESREVGLHRHAIRDRPLEHGVLGRLRRPG